MRDTIPTLFQMKRHLGIPVAVNDQNERLMDAAQAATAYLERETRRRFAPHVATVRHQPLASYRGEIALRDDLLELIAITDADGPVPLDEVEVYPARGIISVLRREAGFAWGEGGLTISGVWGWHDHPARMWVDTQDSINLNPIIAAEPVINVTDADALMSDGLTPRFSVGALVRVGAEYMRVEAVDAAANRLTVMRGVNGTSITPHSVGASITVYRPPYDVLMSALQLAAWLYRQPDAPAEQVEAGVLRAVLGLRRLTVAS